MQRENGKIELREHEIRCLYAQLFGEPIPDGANLEDAALACVFYVGVERVELYLAACQPEK